MAVEAGTLVDRVLQRIRDERATGTARTLVRAVMTHAQRLVNGKLGLVIRDLAFPTVAYQGVYPLATLAPTALRVLGVQQGPRDLTEVPWQEFAYERRTWLRDARSRYESYALIGRNMLVLYPTLAEPGSVSLRVAVLTIDLASDASEIELPDEYHPLLVDLTSAVLLVRQRTFLSVGTLADAIAKRTAA
jgi:hypothetical protein